MRLILVIGIVILVLGLVVMLVIPELTSSVEGVLRWVVITNVFILSGVIAFIAVVFRYRKPRADVALVRTGG
jgi:hypothetical protein